MMRWLSLFAALLLVPAAASAAPLCDDTRPANDLPMREGDFDLYRAERNIELLGSLTEPFGQAIAKAIDHQPTDPASLPSAGTFASSYPNALHQIRGTLLKQRALLAEQEISAARARRHAKEVRAAQATFETARQEFCQYLLTTRFID